MNKRGRPFKSEHRLARATRLNEIIKSMLDGTTNEADLAALYGLSSKQVHQDIVDAMSMITATTLESAEAYRALQLSRHEQYLAKLNKELDAAITAAAPPSTINMYMNTGLKILEQEAKLTSLFTTKFEIQHTTEIKYVLPVDQAAQMLALLESQGLLPEPTVTAEFRELPSEIEGVVHGVENERVSNNGTEAT